MFECTLEIELGRKSKFPENPKIASSFKKLLVVESAVHLIYRPAREKVDQKNWMQVNASLYSEEGTGLFLFCTFLYLFPHNILVFSDRDVSSSEIPV